MFASKGILTSMLPDHLRKNLLTFFSMLHKHIDHTLHIAGHRHFFPVCQHKISGTVNITHTIIPHIFLLFHIHHIAFPVKSDPQSFSYHCMAVSMLRISRIFPGLTPFLFNIRSESLRILWFCFASISFSPFSQKSSRLGRAFPSSQTAFSLMG